MATTSMEAGVDRGGPLPRTAVNSRDNLFAGEMPVDLTYSSAYTMQVNPSSAITDSSVTYQIPRMSSGNCLFLDRLDLAMRVRLVDSKGKKPEAGKNVAPIAAFPQTMFSDVRLYLNDVEVSACENGMYALRAYTAMTLNSSFSARHSMLEAYGYYPDSNGEFQSFSDANAGFEQRRALFGRKKSAAEPFEYFDESVPVYSRLYTDFVSCPLPLISGVGVRIEMRLNQPSFYMLCDDEDASEKGYRLKIESATLLAQVRVLNAGLNLDLEKRLSTSPVTYPLRRVETKKISIAASQQSVTVDTLTQSSVNPDRLLILLIPSELYDGAYGKNPLEACRDFDGGVELSRALLTLNGQVVEDEVATESEHLVMAYYRQLFKVLGQTDAASACANISLLGFAQGFFFILYDLSKGSRAYLSDLARQPTKQGHLRLELGFSAPLNKSVYLFCLAEYHAAAKIDRNRNTVFSFLT